jgi:hypothetical protein
MTGGIIRDSPFNPILGVYTNHPQKWDPKSEARNPKFETNSNTESFKDQNEDVKPKLEKTVVFVTWI